MTATTQAEDFHLGILWGAWAELGLSGWSRSHRDWAVDPEPLIIATALAARRDPRLRDEALDWCVHNWRQISKVRLRNLLRSETSESIEAFAEFAATVNHHAGSASWPGGDARPWKFATTGRSMPPVLKRTSMVWLRLRAITGLGARAEILRYFLVHPGERAGATTLASYAAYNKRVVADACIALEQAGVLTRHQVANRLYYRLDRDSELRALLGAGPPITPDWSALLHVAQAFVDLLNVEDATPARALAVEARRVLSDLESELDELNIRAPEIQPDYWRSFRELAMTTLSSWSRGIKP